MPSVPSLILLLSCAGPSLSLANDSAAWRTFPPAAPTAFTGAASNALLLPHQPHYVFHLRRTAPRQDTMNNRRIAASSIPSGIRSNNGNHHQLSMGGRTELGASPWKTDLRTVQEWLQFSDRELAKLNKALPRPDLEQRLGLLADGQTDSVVVRRLFYTVVQQQYKISLNVQLRDGGGFPSEIAHRLKTLHAANALVLYNMILNCCIAILPSCYVTTTRINILLL